MWSAIYHRDLEKKLKKYLKRHRQETLNALDNLAAYLADLNSGLKPQQIIRNYIRSEGRGVRAADQSGPKHPTKLLRLYFYPDEQFQVLNVITIGDKDSQVDDVKFCHEFVDSLLEQRESENEHDGPKKIHDDS